MKQVVHFCLAVLLCWCGGAGKAWAIDVIDQKQLNFAGTAGYSNETLRQSFTPTASSISGVALAFDVNPTAVPYGATVNITVSLWNADPYTKPAAVKLATTTLAVKLRSSGAVSLAWTLFRWPTVSVTPGNIYQLYIEPTSLPVKVLGTINNYQNGLMVKADMTGFSGTIDVAFYTFSADTGYHHLEITANNPAITCLPTTYTIKACTDAACATPYTGGVTGTFSVAGAGMTTNYITGQAFTIPAGSSTTTEQAQVVTAGTATVGLTGLSPAATNTTQPVYCGLGVAASAAASCSLTVKDSGFIVTVPNHVSATSPTLTIQAVRTDTSTLACAPAITGTLATKLTCSYLNPASGTQPVIVSGGSLNASNSPTAMCDANGKTMNLVFDSTGVAAANLRYTDVGQVRLDVNRTNAGLSLSGSTSFVAVPASFSVSAAKIAPATSFVAGTPFATTVSALNSENSVTPNFGRESPAETATLSFTKVKPTGTNSSDGALTGSLGSFTNGVATANNVSWSEVGTGDLTATLTNTNYLGTTGLTRASGNTGTTGVVGPFIPHHFDVAVTPPCLGGGFAYSGQPFSVKVTARNGLTPSTTTVNYDGTSNTAPNFAKLVTLSDATGSVLGSWGGTNTVAIAKFTKGEAPVTTPTFTFPSAATAPTVLNVRAVDTDNVSSSGYAEGSTQLLSGRINVSNAFGSPTADLTVPMVLQYWDGNAWITNTSDSCTNFPASIIAMDTYTGGLSACETRLSSANSVFFQNGLPWPSALRLTAPGAMNTGTVMLRFNTGTAASGKNCIATTPLPTVPSDATNKPMPWFNPVTPAKASFDVFRSSTIYRRENY